MINIINLSKYFGNKCILNNINARFEKGKIYGIIGKNGAGKTTFFKCLNNEHSFQGEIEFDDVNLSDQLKYLPTMPYFLSYMTGSEYLDLIIHANRLPSIELAEINIFDLPLGQYASHYSTGMKKKLALTGLLIQNPTILVLDEPFNGVDIESNELIIYILKKLRSKGHTILISSHLLSTLKEFCDQLLVLDNSTIVKNVKKDEFQHITDTFNSEMDIKAINKILEIRSGF